MCVRAGRRDGPPRCLVTEVDGGAGLSSQGFGLPVPVGS